MGSYTTYGASLLSFQF